MLRNAGSFIIFLLFTFFLRFPTIYDRFLTEDEGYNILVAEVFLKGEIPYRDFLDFRFVTCIVLALYFFFTGSHSFLFVHIFGNVLITLSAFIIYRIVRYKIHSEKAGYLSGFLSVLLVSFPWHFQETTSELVLNFIGVLCMYLWLSKEFFTNTKATDLCIGALCGLAIAEKLHAVFSIYLLFVFAGIIYNNRCIFSRIIFISAGILLVWSFIFLYYLLNQSFFIYIENILSHYFYYVKDGFLNLFYSDEYYLTQNRKPGFEIPVLIPQGYFKDLLSYLRYYYFPLILITSVFVYKRMKDEDFAEKFWDWIFLYFLIAVVLVFPTFKFYFHYFWLLAPPVSMLSAYLVKGLRKKILRKLCLFPLIFLPFAEATFLFVIFPETIRNNAYFFWDMFRDKAGLLQKGGNDPKENSVSNRVINMKKNSINEESKYAIRDFAWDVYHKLDSVKEVFFHEYDFKRTNWLTGKPAERFYREWIVNRDLQRECVLILGNMPDLYLKTNTYPPGPYNNLDIIKEISQKYGKEYFTDEMRKFGPVVIFDVYDLADKFLGDKYLAQYRKLQEGKYIIYELAE